MLAAATRIINSSTWPVWTDEGWTIWAVPSQCSLPTSQWTLDMLYFDRHALVIPPDLAAGTYQVAVGAYWYGDQRPLLVDNRPNLIVGQIEISKP